MRASVVVGILVCLAVMGCKHAKPRPRWLHTETEFDRVRWAKVCGERQHFFPEEPVENWTSTLGDPRESRLLLARVHCMVWWTKDGRVSSIMVKVQGWLEGREAVIASLVELVRAEVPPDVGEVIAKVAASPHRADAAPPGFYITGGTRTRGDLLELSVSSK